MPSGSTFLERRGGLPERKGGLLERRGGLLERGGGLSYIHWAVDGQKDAPGFARRIGQARGWPVTESNPWVFAGIVPSGTAPQSLGGGRICASVQSAVVK